MSEKQKMRDIIETPARQRLSKELGAEKLNELEKVIKEEAQAEAVILETPARARLKKEIGKEELARIEAQILRGEL